MRKPKKKRRKTPREKSMMMAKKRGRLEHRKSKKKNYSWLTAGKEQNIVPNILAMFKPKKGAKKGAK